MSLKLTYSVTISHADDGAGPLGFPVNGPARTFTGVQVVAGLSTPTGAQITTACPAMGTDISTQANVAAVLTQLQGFETGGV